MDNHTCLVYVEWGKSKPLFLKTSENNILRLFGGRETAAAIDENGSIIFISEAVFDSPNMTLPSFCLPDGEKASCVACGRTFIFALSLSGVVSSCKISADGKIDGNFTKVKELEDIKCIQVSSMWDNYFVVTDDYRFCFWFKCEWSNWTW